MTKTLQSKLLLTACSMFLISSVMAIDTGSRNFTLNGRIKQGFSGAYDLPNDDLSTGPSNYLVEVKSSYRPNRQWTFIGNLWLRGDWAPSFDSYTVDGTQAPDPTTGFLSRLPNRIHDGSCTGGLTDPFCDSSHEIRQLNDIDEVIRELSIKYRDTKNRFTIKLGKFQRGWGQSDGLRLLDVLHAQDLRERFAFRDSDELRIPAWMISADFNFKKMGIAGPFEALGMKRPILEFNFVPEVHHSEFVINNPTPGNRSSGGIFGLPWPRLADPVSGLGLVGLSANLTNREVDRFDLSESEYSLRLKFNALGGQFTLNGFYGVQDLPVVKLTGATVAVGNPFNNEPAAIAAGGNVLQLPLPLTIAAYNGPGGYTDWLRATGRALAGTGAPIAFPLSTGGIAPASVLGGAADCFDPVLATPGLPCSLNANFDLDYTHRQKMIGFSFSRDMGEMKFGPKDTSPSLRLEVAYEFDKPFNRSQVPGAFAAVTNEGVAIESGSNVLINDPDVNITESDVISTMVGFDYPLWVPGWDGQQKSVFTSFQFFNIHTFDANEGLLQQAPYGFDTVSKDQQFVTFLWNAPILDERLVLEGLYIRDFDNKGTFYRQRLDFNFFGNKWRPRLEWMHFSGEGENAPIGILNNSDFIEFSISYQF